MNEVPSGAVDLTALAKHLVDDGVPVTGELRASLISGGKSNLTVEVRDDASRWVLRRPPVAGLTPSAHDMAREYRITSALRGSGVPVAGAVSQCADDSVLGAPFAMWDFVDGRVVRSADDLSTLSATDIESCTTELVDVLARLHAVDQDAVGLGDLGRPSGYLERQVALWARQWGHVRDVGNPDADDADVEELHRRLAVSIPASYDTTIVHGDYRVDNVILSDTDAGRIAAVVDWELSTLGDPLSDIALMCVYRDPALDRVLGFRAAWTDERWPDADDLAHRYALASGRTVDRWDFYLGLAYFKLAVVAAGIAYRHREGAETGAGADTAVAPLVARGLEVTAP